VNLVFIGASRFGLRCLELACDLPEINVVGIVTAPPVFSISYRPSGVTNVLHADMRGFAQRRAIPLTELEGSMNDPTLLDRVRAWSPDVFLVAGWYHMVPRSWRKLAPAYGLHASLLPDYSGGAPLVWAMINGEAKTGITLFQMDDGVDSGPIAGQADEPIHPDDTIATLYARIEERGLELLRTTLPALAVGTLRLQPQNDLNREIMPQRSPADGRIDWTQDATAIDRFIRAQTRPYPGAFTTLDEERLTIWRGKIAAGSQFGRAGLVGKTPNGYAVACGAGGLDLVEISWRDRVYTAAQLAEVLGPGGQRLGSAPDR
jgi:methionyl-tRNA formyltransferase